MKSFTYHKGLVVPLDRSNVDTDLIIPKQFLKSIKRTGFGPNLFDELRYLDHGEPDIDNKKRPLNPNFVLNKKRYQGASILLSRKNFGCGSSREHAAWALVQYGFRVIIATSYADIFFNNSSKNGLCLIALSESKIDDLFQEVEKKSGYQLIVDLNNQLIITPENYKIDFNIEPFRKYCLSNGLDDIDLTLRFTNTIREFEKKYFATYPWLENF